MTFEIQYAQKLDKQYIISGRLIYNLDDYDFFSEIRESYRTLVTDQNMNFGIHLIIREDYIEFQKVALDTVSNILNLFRQNLNAKISLKFREECTYEPRNCEPLVKMAARRQFQ